MELMIPLDTRSDAPMYEQIYQYIKNEIKAGSLCAAQRLPSTRLLAENLKVSRSTTQLAYDQLLSEGYVESVPCKGYFVANMEGLVAVRQEAPGNFLEQRHASDGDDRQQYAVDFSPRGVDLNSFPFYVWKKLSKSTLVDDNKEMFNSGNPQGEKALRESIRSYLHSARGVSCDSEQIIVGAGSEYLLMLLSQILGSGRKIAMENPTYRQAYLVFDSMGHAVEPIAMDESGMQVTLLSKSSADLAYIMPSHHYPMGIVMPVRRRLELLKWAAEKEERYLIEDDYDSEFRYRGKPIPALQGMDRQGSVIYIGSFSKCIAPAIRVSYMVLPHRLLAEYRKRAGFYSSTVSRIDQNILFQFLSGGYFERHLNRMRAMYKAKHDVLMNSLKPFEADFQIRGEHAGLHILMTHRGGMGEAELTERAASAGVRVYGLSSFFIHPEHSPENSTVILGYATLSEEEIAQGVKLLLTCWEAGQRAADGRR